MTELPRHPEASTEELRKLDGWYTQESAAIMRSEALTPAAKRKRLEELRADYRDRWIQAKHTAQVDLAEWSEVFKARAETAWEPKAPKDKDAGILRALEIQRLHARIERHKDQPGRLLAEYEKAIRSGNGVVAHELEDALPDLLPEGERQSFEARAKENRLARMSEADRKKVEEAEAYSREAMAAGQGLALQEMARSRGYVPGQPSPTMVVNKYTPGGDPPQAVEMPNPAWRDPAQQLPNTNPGTLAPFSSGGGAA